jgi:hypothetical protein
VVSLDIHHTSLRANGRELEIVEHFPFVLSMSKHSESFFSNLLKKRVALPGRGKRGSTRTLVASNGINRWFFVFGFEKNDRDNVTSKELSALKALASDLFRLGVSELSAAVAAKTLREICHEN